MASKMDTVSKSGKMAANMTDNGRMTKHMVTVSSFTQTVIFTKGPGSTIRRMAMGHTSTPMAQRTLANGSKISSMVAALRSGPTVPSMKGNTRTERSTAKAA